MGKVGGPLVFLVLSGPIAGIADGGKSKAILFNGFSGYRRATGHYTVSCRIHSCFCYFGNQIKGGISSGLCYFPDAYVFAGRVCRR
jgi:hypothetical protein